MKLLIISLRTTGLMKELFEDHCKTLADMVSVYCVTNDNITDDSLGRIKGSIHVRFKRKEPWTYLSINKILQINNYIDKVNPDIVLFYTPHPDNIFILQHVKKRCIVAQIHNPLPHSGTPFMERIVSGMQKKLYFKYCSAIFVSGMKLKQDIIEHFYYPAERIFSIKFGALSNLPVNDEILPELYDLIFFGRIEYYKGIDVLLDSTKYMNKKLKIVIAGKGTPYFDVSAANAYVTFFNSYVDDATLVKLIKQSKIVVMPYRDATGTSTVLQAFMFSKPVVASDVGVFKEYVGMAGTIVPANDARALADAITDILSNDGERIRMGEVGKEYLNTIFNIKNVCKEYVDILSNIYENKELWKRK